MTTKSLRSQFKATSIKSLQKAVDKDNAMVGANNNEYINLEDGKTTKLRIFPAHPGEENFYVSRKCYWLPFFDDEGEPRRGAVLDSIVHGGTSLDIIQEYVRFAKKKYGSDNEKMELLVGTGMNSKSLNPQYSWLSYAAVVKEGENLSPKIWEFKKMVRDMLNKLAFSEDEDEPIEVDPFTDPDEGTPVLVKYTKKPNRKRGEQYYEVSLAKKSRAITDEELENFAKLKPLTEIIPKYSMRDFDRALEGLQNFDEENDFKLFDDDDWLDIVEQVKSQYEDDNEEEKGKKKVVNKTSKKKKEEDEADDDEEKAKYESDEDDKEADDEDMNEEDDKEADDEDEFSGMDRTSLKRYIKNNGLEIVVRKTMSDDDIREAIREAIKADDAEETNSDEDEEEDDEDEDDEAKSKVSLDDIRKKLAGKK